MFERLQELPGKFKGFVQVRRDDIYQPVVHLMPVSTALVSRAGGCTDCQSDQTLVGGFLRHRCMQPRSLQKLANPVAGRMSSGQAVKHAVSTVFDQQAIGSKIFDLP